MHTRPAKKVPLSGCIKYLLVSLVAAVVGALLLLLVSCIPQTMIYDHALESAEQLLEEGDYPKHHLPSAPMPYLQDNLSEEIIVETSYNMHTVQDVFLKLRNTRLQNPEADNAYAQLLMNVLAGEETVMRSYSRYWMGFRLPVRLLLCVTSLNGIRMLIGAAFVLLLTAVVALAARRVSVGAAAGFALAIWLIEPYAVSHSIQYGICFLLALMFSLLVLFWKHELKDPKTVALFCAFGAITQYFDFYTSPSVTCLLPLLLLAARSEEDRLVRKTLPLFLAWLTGYLLMWVLGLCFVTLFTPENAFLPALHSAMYRFGVGSEKVAGDSYRAVDALVAVYRHVCSRIPISHVPDFALPALVLGLIVLAAAARLRAGRWGKLPVYAVLGLLPLCWFAAAAQPTIGHTYFQYRTICPLYFAVFLFSFESIYLLHSVRPEKKQ